MLYEPRRTARNHFLDQSHEYASRIYTVACSPNGEQIASAANAGIVTIRTAVGNWNDKAKENSQAEPQ